MVPTLAELANLVGDDIQHTDLTAQCSAAIALAIRQLDQKRWWFNEETATFTTTSTTTTYALPSDFKAIDYIETRLASNTSGWQEVVPRDFATVRKSLDTDLTATGAPEIYNIRGNQLHIANGGGNEYLVKLYYVKSLADLTANGSNTWTTTYQDLIRATAAKTVALRTLHDTELAALQDAVRRHEYAALVEENERRVAQGMVTPFA